MREETTLMNYIVDVS